MSKIFDRDPTLGITRLWHYDETTDRATIETVTDVTDIVEESRALYNAHDERARFGGGDGMVRVASLPLSIHSDLKRRGILDDQKKFAAWLNDPDNRAFRTRPGKV